MVEMRFLPYPVSAVPEISEFWSGAARHWTDGASRPIRGNLFNMLSMEIIHLVPFFFIKRKKN